MMKHVTNDFLVISEMEKSLILALRYGSPASSVYTIARATSRKWQEVSQVLKPYDEALSRKELNVDRLRDQGKRLLTSLGYYAEDGTFDMSKIPPPPAAPSAATKRQDNPKQAKAVGKDEPDQAMEAKVYVDTPKDGKTQQALDLFDFRSIAHHWLKGIEDGFVAIDSFGYRSDPDKGTSVTIVLKGNG